MTTTGAGPVTTTGIAVSHLGGDRFRIHVRGHRVDVDQPVAAGGEDTAPTPACWSARSRPRSRRTHGARSRWCAGRRAPTRRTCWSALTARRTPLRRSGWPWPKPAASGAPWWPVLSYRLPPAAEYGPNAGIDEPHHRVALDRAGFAIVATGLKQCLAESDGADTPDSKAMERLFLSLA